MAKKLKSFETKRDQFVKATLRRASIRWPEKNEAKKASRIERGVYQCAQCKQGFRGDEVQLDHISPVVSITEGFIDWDKYIKRLFVKAEQYQVLCFLCHETKTFLEDRTRDSLNKSKIRIDKRKKKG